MLFEEDALKGNQKKKGKPFSSINDILYVSGHVYERGPPRDLSFRREVHLIHTHTHTHTYTPPLPLPPYNAHIFAKNTPKFLQK